RARRTRRARGRRRRSRRRPGRRRGRRRRVRGEEREWGTGNRERWFQARDVPDPTGTPSKVVRSQISWHPPFPVPCSLFPPLPPYNRRMTKTAFITGATSGFGRAAVERFVAAGWRVVACGRRAERLQALVDALGADKVHAAAFD